MKAVVFDRYGGPEGLRLAEIPVPQRRKGEVRLRVRAVSLNLSDWEYLTGRPAYARLGGLFRPRQRILGSDIVGEVIEGPEDMPLVRGQRVFGDVVMRRGGFAEEACLPLSDLAPVPEGLSDEVAACLPQAGAIAVQGMEGITAGQRVLINGAGGGSGTLALQRAKAAGAHVTVVDAASKLDWLRGLGADACIDYRTQDFAATGQRWDRILDLVATRPARAISGALTPTGHYRAVGGAVPVLLSLALAGPLRRIPRGQSIGILAVRTGRDVTAALGQMALDGALRPVIDSVMPLAAVPEALRRVGAGEVRGKIVIRVASD